jgi:hypothetical protein
VPLIWLEILLGFGAPVAWGVWELHALRRDRLAAARRATEQHLADRGGSSAGSRPTPPA